MKTQTFHRLKYDLRGHQRSHNVILKLQNHTFLRYIFCLTPDLFFLNLKMKYNLERHIRPLLCNHHSSTFVYGMILMKICMNFYFKTFRPNYNLVLLSYGRLLSLFICLIGLQGDGES